MSLFQVRAILLISMAGPIVVQFVVSWVLALAQIDIESFALFRNSVCGYVCFTVIFHDSHEMSRLFSLKKKKKNIIECRLLKFCLVL